MTEVLSNSIFPLAAAEALIATTAAAASGRSSTADVATTHAYLTHYSRRRRF